MSKIGDILGIIVAVVIIALAITVFNYDGSADAPKIKSVKLEEISAPQFELEKSYGGDAYTGIQQASAQTANNLIPVFKVIQQNNEAVKSVNDNLAAMAEADADNLDTLMDLVRYCFGSLLLSVGMLTAVKHIGSLLTPRKKETTGVTV